MTDRDGNNGRTDGRGEGPGPSPSGAEALRRRDFLKLVAAGAGVAAAGCDRDRRRYLYPYLVPPTEALPGQALVYASVCRECPAGCGVHARVREGRVVKLEGNPDHPVNRGALCARGQGALQRAYDPKRFLGPQRRGARGWESIGWDEALGQVAEALLRTRDNARAAGGAGAPAGGRALLMTGVESGPTEGLLVHLAGELRGEWITLDPHGVEPLLQGYDWVFGTRDLPRFQLGDSDLVVALEADLFETFVSPVELARQIAGPERADGSRAELVCVGPRRGTTGILADAWLPTRPGTAGWVALALLAEFRTLRPEALRGYAGGPDLGGALAAYAADKVAERVGVPAAELTALARRLSEARRPVVLSGGSLAAEGSAAASQSAVALLNLALGAFGTSLRFGARSALAGVTEASLVRSVLDKLGAGALEVVLVSGTNPVFDLPGGLEVDRALERARLVVALTDRPDATTEHAHLVLPTSGPLEGWDSYSPREGIEGLCQPVLDRIFNGRSRGEIFADLLRRVAAPRASVVGDDSYELLVRRGWPRGRKGVEGDAGFEEALRRGGVFTEPDAVQPSVVSRARLLPRELESGPVVAGEIRPVPYASARAGRYERSPGGWLDELPEPMTAAVWGAPAELHPELAGRLGLSEGDGVEIRGEGGSIRLPVKVTPGVRPDVVGVPVDGGRRFEARASRLLPAAALAGGNGVEWVARAVTLAAAAVDAPLFREAYVFDQHGRGIARARGGVKIHGHGGHEPEALPENLTNMYAGHEHAGHRWGLAVDLDKCTGCSACIVACYAENNIPVVGAEAVDYGREMAWLQIQLYWEQDAAGRALPLIVPVMCQQCDHAPCEPVCPVFAAYHTAEGLNGQVYNRCVGTRYCANNCPYKVRRFNWQDGKWPSPLHLQLNPDVTVRSQGVMEKCTFCVQRIRSAKERAKLEERPLRDGEIRPACAQTCPTGALVFGDLLDPESAVSRLWREERGYPLLGQIGTRPAVRYLERIVRWRG